MGERVFGKDSFLLQPVEKFIELAPIRCDGGFLDSNSVRPSSGAPFPLIEPFEEFRHGFARD